MQKSGLLFGLGVVAGVVIGGGVVGFMNQGAAKSVAESTAQPEKTAPVVQVVEVPEVQTIDFSGFIKPDYSQNYEKFARKIFANGKLEPSYDYNQMMSLYTFLCKVELQLRVSEKLAALSGKEREEFIKSYQQWYGYFQSECQKPLVGEDGEELEGSMWYAEYNARPGELIEAYLNKTFPERKQQPAEDK